MSEVLSTPSTHTCLQAVWVPCPHLALLPAPVISSATLPLEDPPAVQSSLIQPSSCEAGAMEPAGGANEAWRGTVVPSLFLRANLDSQLSTQILLGLRGWQSGGPEAFN